MCMKSTPEGCELREELKETKATVASLDTRLTKVEHVAGEIRTAQQELDNAAALAKANAPAPQEGAKA